MNTRTVIKVTFGTLGLLALVTPLAQAEPARWGGGFGGGETRSIPAGAGQTRWAAGWGGQERDQKVATPARPEPAPRTYWSAGWGGEQENPVKTVDSTDLARR
jgi:hypothetical protein